MLKVCWFEKYHSKIEDDIANAVGSNNFNTLFQGVLMASRDETGLIDQNAATFLVDAITQQGIKTIWDAGITNGTCKLLLDTLVLGSEAQLTLVSNTFRQKNAKDLADVVSEAFSDNKSVAKAINSRFLTRYVLVHMCVC